VKKNKIIGVHMDYGTAKHSEKATIILTALKL
jgi:hypothetical protein